MRPSAEIRPALSPSPWRGPWTLFAKEVRRFFRVPGQTIISPVITTVLYLVVFGFALGGSGREIGGVPYLSFIVPGLVMLGVISNSFLNSSTSMFIMRLQETVVDILVSPLRHGEIVGAMVGAATVRALLVGALTWMVAAIAQGELLLRHGLYVFLFPTLTGIGMGALGLLVGIWSEKFEHVNVVPTFVVVPLTFLGGVFYDVGTLPGIFGTISLFNPVVYLVDGMRYAMLGVASTSPLRSLVGLLIFDLVVLQLCLFVLRRGWKLRS